MNRVEDSPTFIPLPRGQTTPETLKRLSKALNGRALLRLIDVPQYTPEVPTSENLHELKDGAIISPSR